MSGTAGNRDDLFRDLGTRELPTLKLPDGTLLINPAAIIKWAGQQKALQGIEARCVETYEPVKAAHDSGTPAELLTFMTQSWEMPSGPVPTLAGRERFAARRRIIAQKFPGDVLVIPTGREKVRANDTNYRFRPGTDFYYLTGILEPDAVLVIVPEGDDHRAIVFTEPNPGKTNATFFTDRVKGELWVGPRLGVTATAARFVALKRSRSTTSPRSST